MKFSTALLPEDITVRVAGQRPVKLSVAVLEGTQLRGLFRDEKQADAYVRHLNKIERSMTCPS